MQHLTESADSIAWPTKIEGTYLLAASRRSSKELREFDSAVELEEGWPVKQRRLTAAAMASKPMSGTIGFTEASLVLSLVSSSIFPTSLQRWLSCSSFGGEDFSFLSEVGGIEEESVEWLQDRRAPSASNEPWGIVGYERKHQFLLRSPNAWLRTRLKWRRKEQWW